MQGYQNGDIIEVKHKCTPDLPSRNVTYKNGGILAGEHWFRWDFFFEVNFIVTKGVSL